MRSSWIVLIIAVLAGVYGVAQYMRQSDRRIEETNEKLAQQAKEINDLKQKLEQKKKSTRAATEIQAELTALQTSLDSELAAIHSDEQDLSDWRNQTYRKEVFQGSSQELKLQKQTVDRLQARVNQLRDQEKTLKSEVSVNTKEFKEKQRGDAEYIRQQVQVQEVHLRDLKAEKEELRQQRNPRNRELILQKDAQIHEAEVTLNQLKSDLNWDKNQDLSQQRSAVATVRAREQNIKEQLQTAQRQLADEKEKYQLLQQTAQDDRSNVDQQSKSIKELEVRLQNRRKTVEDLKQRIAQDQRELSSL